MQDSHMTDKQKSSRRSFFAGAAGVTAAAAAVAVLPKVDAVSAAPSRLPGQPRKRAAATSFPST